MNSSDRSASEKRKMCLSDETLYGIRMTGLYQYLYIQYVCDCNVVFQCSPVICRNDKISLITTRQ